MHEKQSRDWFFIIWTRTNFLWILFQLFLVVFCCKVQFPFFNLIIKCCAKIWNWFVLTETSSNTSHESMRKAFVFRFFVVSSISPHLYLCLFCFGSIFSSLRFSFSHLRFIKFPSEKIFVILFMTTSWKFIVTWINRQRHCVRSRAVGNLDDGDCTALGWIGSAVQSGFPSVFLAAHRGSLFFFS